MHIVDMKETKKHIWTSVSETLTVETSGPKGKIPNKTSNAQIPGPGCFLLYAIRRIGFQSIFSRNHNSLDLTIEMVLKCFYF